MEKQPLIRLFLLLGSFSYFFFLSYCEENPSLESSERYWKLREEEAHKRNAAAFVSNPYEVTNHLNFHARKLQSTWIESDVGRNNTRRGLGKKIKGCVASNPIDACWRCRADWEKKRKKITKCVLGFGRGTTGGKAGRKYVITDPSDDDMVNPKPGTLRHAVTRDVPLWIVFGPPIMTIRLNQELIMNSNKSIDGRGSHVTIQGGAGITVQSVENIIIHGIRFKNIVEGNGGKIRDSEHHYGDRTKSDGDAISVFASHHVWIDHCSFSKASDGLVDVIMGSTAITISNCHMTNHHMAFLFGASDTHFIDRQMQITVAYTHFGKQLEQRMPRCRFGFFHIVNNDYTHWQMYAIGGSKHPTIISEGNRFVAPDNPHAKEVTHRLNPDSPYDSGTWISNKDLLLNGATFLQSPALVDLQNMQDKIIPPMDGQFAGHAAQSSGPLRCIPNLPC